MIRFYTIVVDDDKSMISLGTLEHGDVFSLWPACTTFDDFEDRFDHIFGKILPEKMLDFWKHYKGMKDLGVQLSRGFEDGKAEIIIKKRLY